MSQELDRIKSFMNVSVPLLNIIQTNEQTDTKPFLGAFAKLRKATISFVVSVHHPPAWNKSAPTGQILMKLDICVS
jgi:hypothetical protein